MIARKDHTDMLRQAAFPIQWIAGKEDNIIPYGKILELGHKSNINFISLYAGCGHMSMIEAHKKLIPDLKKFINFSNNGPNNLV
jgi:pimeloyl-ACP methyl ester carboxylesterase